MVPKRFVVMGAGEVGRYLARSLSADGHNVTLIDSDPGMAQVVEEQLDAAFVLGNGTHIPTLEAARVAECDLFVAASSSDEANLAASLLAKRVGAPRTVVRVKSSEGVTRYGRIYETTFQADLLLSTQLLTTTRVLNHVLGYNTLDVEYLAAGALQVRRTTIEEGSALAQHSLADAHLPKDCLVLAYVSADGEITVPTGDTRARVGDDALVIGTPRAVDTVERRVSQHSRRLGLVVVAGGGATARAVIEGLQSQAKRIKIIELDRRRAEELAAIYPDCDVIHGDTTDMSVLASEGVGSARTFIALTGNDETNLMACLLAQELGATDLTALVQKSETSSLWSRIALLDIVSPRMTAAQRIRTYIRNDYESHIVSFENGAAEFVQRTVYGQSPVAGSSLADVEIPQGLLVAAVLRDGKAFIPRGQDHLLVNDEVILFARREERDLVQLLFPGPVPDPEERVLA